VLVMVCLALATLATLRTDDALWLLRVGTDLLKDGVLPATNRYSFTAPDFPWQTHEWLSEVLLALADRVGGEPLLFVLGLGGVWLSVLLVARGAQLQNGSTRAAVLAAIVVTPFIASAGMMLRPYLVGRVLLVIVLGLAPVTASWRRALGMAALFSLWANLHGSFGLGAGVLIVNALVASATERRGAVADLLAAFLGACLTPLGLSGALFPLRYLTMMGQQHSVLDTIVEWQPVGTGPGLVWWLIGTALLAGSLAFSKRPMRERMRDGVIAAAFATLALRAVRGLPDLGVMAAFVAGRHLRVPGPESRLRTWRPAVALAVVLVTAVAVDPVRNALGFDRYLAVRERVHPTPALDDLRRLPHPPRRLFSILDWGGAVLAQQFPTTRVFIDARNDCYPLEVFERHRRILEAGPDALSLLQAAQVDGVLLPPEEPLLTLLQARGWSTAHADDAAVLLTRRVVP
jgi:hypothetical protein